MLLPVPSFAAVIFTAGGGKAARACACRDARVAHMHDDEHLRDEHLPQLALALVSWLRATLRQHEHVPLADRGRELLLDTHGLERATEGAPSPPHQLQTAACLAICGIDLARRGDGAGSLAVQLSVRVEGRRLFRGTNRAQRSAPF